MSGILSLGDARAPAAQRALNEGTRGYRLICQRLWKILVSITLGFWSHGCYVKVPLGPPTDSPVEETV